MLPTNIDCHKCGYSNRLGTLYCRNCGVKLKFDKNLVVHKNKRVRKVIWRAVKSIVFITAVTILALAFFPFGFPETPKLTDEKEIAELLGKCSEVDVLPEVQFCRIVLELTPAEATFIANYFSREHKKLKGAPPRERPGFNSPLRMGSPGNMGGGSIGVGGRPSMKFAPKPAPGSAAPSAPKPDTPPGNAAPAVPVSTFDFSVGIKDDKTLSLVVKDQWFGVLPCRLELFIEPELAADAKTKTQTLKYNLTGARFGLLPLPLSLEKHVFSLFKSLIMPERKWADRYLKYVKNIEIKPDQIKITLHN
ncbi:MAG: zinc ribbon domain-containing protein [Victivallaceae bacterium]|nr:zinc ribbon domain-containing protein [Victivallaceae bacterium]